MTRLLLGLVWLVCWFCFSNKIKINLPNLLFKNLCFTGLKCLFFSL